MFVQLSFLSVCNLNNSISNCQPTTKNCLNEIQLNGCVHCVPLYTATFIFKKLVLHLHTITNIYIFLFMRNAGCSVSEYEECQMQKTCH